MMEEMGEQELENEESGEEKMKKGTRKRKAHLKTERHSSSPECDNTRI
jgi:hypothetical protein